MTLRAGCLASALAGCATPTTVGYLDSTSSASHGADGSSTSDVADDSASGTTSPSPETADGSPSSTSSADGDPSDSLGPDATGAGEDEGSETTTDSAADTTDLDDTSTDPSGGTDVGGTVAPLWQVLIEVKGSDDMILVVSSLPIECDATTPAWTECGWVLTMPFPAALQGDGTSHEQSGELVWNGPEDDPLCEPGFNAQPVLIDVSTFADDLVTGTLVFEGGPVKQASLAAVNCE